MSTFLDTRGNTKLSIAICGRCKRKVAYDELREDGNIAGLMVCGDDGCWDPVDPWRLPPRETEDITLEHPRPDIKFGAPGPEFVTKANDLPAAVTTLQPSHAWRANAPYQYGDQVTATNPVGFVAAGQEFWLFTCILPGQSGANPPTWPTQPGVTVQDGTVTWLNTGLYLP